VAGGWSDKRQLLAWFSVQQKDAAVNKKATDIGTSVAVRSYKIKIGFVTTQRRAYIIVRKQLPMLSLT
jgi:hypothetical protein